MRKSYHKIIFYALIVISFTFISAEVLASGTSCSSITVNTVCRNATNNCCDWYDAGWNGGPPGCYPSSAGSTGASTKPCPNYNVINCDQANNRMTANRCDGVGATCDYVSLYNCSIFTCAYQGTTCVNKPFCGDRIPQTGEECDDGASSESFTSATIRDLVYGTYWNLIADQANSSADAFCRSKGWDKALSYTTSTVTASDKRAIFAQSGLTNQQLLHVNDSITSWGSSGLGLTYVDWYDASTLTTSPYLIILQTVTCTNDATKKANGVPCTITAYGGSCTYCNNTCGNVIIVQRCGDGVTTKPVEECDDGNTLNGDKCSSICQNTNCGDGICSPSENISTCFDDCGAQGWHTANDTWNLTVNRYLQSDGNGVIYSDPFDLKNNTNYNLSFIITNSGRTINVAVDGTCTNSSMLQDNNCFVSQGIIVTTDGTEKLYATIVNINGNPKVTDGSYFRNARIKIISTGSGNSYAIIHNISLKEQTDVQYSEPTPYGASQLGGCCPLNYCWDGNSCLDSNDWMISSQKSPIWNDIISIGWAHDHVNESYQTPAKGYRCVVTNYSNGEAQWVLSDIKYDWNYETSGYCAGATDCFVSKDYPAMTANYSDGCVHDGDIVDGNHYCHQGNWTTKSYIIATLLQNISVNQSHPYILQCYEDATLNYNSLQISNINSSCIMVMQISPTNEQIITGVILDNVDYADTFLNNILSEYSSTNGINDIVIPYPCTGTNNAVSGSNFSVCVDNANAKQLFVYYETNYKYFLISDRSIPGITATTFWQRIVDFFKRLFGNRAVKIQPYNVINYTTNYDNIYIMRSPVANVTAIEESKYDEQNQSIVSILYVNYNGSSDANNPINRDSLFTRVNDTMRDRGLSNYIVYMNYTYTSNTQELILRTQERSELWPYITTILRNRP